MSCTKKLMAGCVGRAGASAMSTRAAYGGTDECCDPEHDCYGSRDPWYTQSQTSRPTFDVVWGSQQSQLMTATGISAAATSDPDRDGYLRTHHPVPLDAPDVALRGQRLMAYGERLRREEEQITQESGRALPTGRPHRPPMERLAPETRVRRPRTPLLVDGIADAGKFLQPRQQKAEPEMYREPRDAPKFGRQSLDIGAPYQPRRREPAWPAMPPLQYVEVPVYDDQYGIAVGQRHTARPDPPHTHTHTPTTTTTTPDGAQNPMCSKERSGKSLTTPYTRWRSLPLSTHGTRAGPNTCEGRCTDLC